MLKQILEQYRNGERGLPTYGELEAIAGTDNAVAPPEGWNEVFAAIAGGDHDGHAQINGGGHHYRKKPVVIEAVTFDELVAHGKAHSHPGLVVNGMAWSFSYKGHPITHENDNCYLIPTLEGTMRFERGDMLITGVKGEIYPCKADIFAATYTPEPANDNEPGAAQIGMRDRKYVDSTPHLHVGNSAFEDWYQQHPKACVGDKQLARDAYAAGMGDPLVMARDAAQQQAEPGEDERAAFEELAVHHAARIVSMALARHYETAEIPNLQDYAKREILKAIDRAAQSGQRAGNLSEATIQALWDEACKDSPQNPGWSRHIRFARTIEQAGQRAGVADKRITKGIGALRYLLNIGSENPDELMGAFMDSAHTSDGRTTREALELLWEALAAAPTQQQEGGK